jgi:TetR/AcrR family transcriptional regulator of autoinduction and epiphytic fitness
MSRRSRWARQNDDVGTPTREPDPRLERSRHAVLEAALGLLVECGYGDVTIEAVAARSGVAKSTIYRHWPGGRADLLNDAFQELKPPPIAPTDGDVRERVGFVLEQVARSMSDSTWSACLPALIEAAERDPAAREFHCRMSEQGRRVLTDVLEEGVRNRELPAGLDTELVADALAGPIIVRRLMSLDPLEPERIRSLVDQVLGCS